MKTVIEMAREAGFLEGVEDFALGLWVQDTDITEIIERFAELVRADERNSWPAEMEAMERQVNILTDALAQARADEREQGQKWFDAVTAQYKQAILAEREACAKVADAWSKRDDDAGAFIGRAIRARSNT